MRVNCPECGAGLKSSTGFAIGQPVACPKCESEFTVEDPDAVAARKPGRAAADDRPEDDTDDRPKKKRRSDDDADEGSGSSYKNSWVRYTILGVLVIILVTLAILMATLGPGGLRAKLGLE